MNFFAIVFPWYDVGYIWTLDMENEWQIFPDYLLQKIWYLFFWSRLAIQWLFWNSHIPAISHIRLQDRKSIQKYREFRSNIEIANFFISISTLRLIEQLIKVLPHQVNSGKLIYSVGIELLNEHRRTENTEKTAEANHF